MSLQEGESAGLGDPCVAGGMKVGDGKRAGEVGVSDFEVTGEG